jgi:hypothetical protein
MGDSFASGVYGERRSAVSPGIAAGAITGVRGSAALASRIESVQTHKPDSLSRGMARCAAIADAALSVDSLYGTTP